MKKSFQSLKFDLIFDLSLLTFCALILSQGILIVLFRIQFPKETEPMLAGWFEFFHKQVIADVQEQGLSPAELIEASKKKGNPDSLIQRLNVTQENDASRAALLSHEGELIPRVTDYLFFFPKVTSYEYLVPVGDKVLRYELSLSPFHEMLSSFKYRAFLIMILIEIFLVFIGYYLLFRRNILVPIENLGRFSKEFLAENWSARCMIGRKDELGSVAEALNEMAAKIQDKEKKLFLTIESLKQANSELEARQHEQLQIEKLASIGRLAAGVAHEVGNPLGAIAGYVDILKRAIEKVGGSKEDQEICDRIEAEANRISKIIRALLQQARPTKERIKSVMLKPVLVRSVQLAQIPATIDVQFDFEDEAAEVYAEEDQLVQIFLNIIMNARHAIEEHKSRKDPGVLKIKCKERKLPVYKASHQDPNDYDTSVVRSLKPEVYWVVSIEDNGIGISESDQKKLFEPFFSTKAPGKGTGLGLYVTKSIIESFRGAIVVRSAPQYGAAFSVFLPKARSAFPAELMSIS